MVLKIDGHVGAAGCVKHDSELFMLGANELGTVVASVFEPLYEWDRLQGARASSGGFGDSVHVVNLSPFWGS
jgi:hypothetical protein